MPELIHRQPEYIQHVWVDPLQRSRRDLPDEIVELRAPAQGTQDDLVCQPPVAGIGLLLVSQSVNESGPTSGS